MVKVMDELISRQAAIDAWKEDFKGFVNSLDMQRDDYKGIMGYIDEVPYAQPERKKGKWTEANTHTFGIYECDVCKGWTYIPNKPSEYNFCPRCGADMREGEKNEDD